MKVVIKLIKPRAPRNPIVVSARGRKAGKHMRGGGGVRQRAGTDLRRELVLLRSAD